MPVDCLHGIPRPIIKKSPARKISSYRTSWETILGGVPPGTFADNPKKWSGDHAASDVADTDGILIANVPINAEHPGIVDIAPSVLAYFGKPRPAHYAGQPLLANGEP